MKLRDFKMQLPNYIPIQIDEVFYIMSTSPPYYIGKVVQFESHLRMVDWIAEKKLNTGRCIAGQVPDYSILVVFNGCLNRLDCSLPESAYIFKQMANWYLENRIKGKGRYNKYLQNV